MVKTDNQSQFMGCINLSVRFIVGYYGNQCKLLWESDKWQSLDQSPAINGAFFYFNQSQSGSSISQEPNHQSIM